MDFHQGQSQSNESDRFKDLTRRVIARFPSMKYMKPKRSCRHRNADVKAKNTNQNN